jgi:hypothetical protein
MAVAWALLLALAAPQALDWIKDFKSPHAQRSVSAAGHS